MTKYRLDVFLSQFETSLLSHVQFCYFLTCIQVSQETGKMVWYSYLFKNFSQFVMIHTVKCFSIIKEAEVDVFLNPLAFSMIQQNFDNLISGSSSFSKPSLDIWKFLVHIMLKPSMQDFKHDLTGMEDECNCLMVSTFFSTALLGDWDKD